MTDRAGNDPGELLAQSRSLAHRVRVDQRATWFALLVLAAITVGAIPVERYGHFSRTCRTLPADIPVPGGGVGRVCTAYSTAGFVYWPIALTVAYAVIAAFYVRRGRARGVGTRVTPYAVAGLALAAIFTAVSIWWAHNPDPSGRHILGIALQGPDGATFLRLVGPAGAIGLGLVVLAALERSAALFVVTVVYLIAVAEPSEFGWQFHHPTRWAVLPHLVAEAVVLAVAGLGFLWAERRGAHDRFGSAAG